MKSQLFAEKRPFLFSFLILLLLFLVNAAGVIAARRRGLPPTTFALLSELALVLIMVVIVQRLGWWRAIGFRPAARPAALLLFLPALALLVGNLTFGIHVSALPALLDFALLAAASGFVEEVMFRGLILHAFLPRGAWWAVAASTLFFGLSHILNVLAGGNLFYVLVQVAYALAIGFGFAAMALRGRLLWPLIIAHALGNFIAFINSDTGQVTGSAVNQQVIIVSLVYIVLFTGYGVYLMRTPYKTVESGAAAPKPGGDAARL